MTNLLIILNLIVVIFAVKLKAKLELHIETSKIAEEEVYLRKNNKNAGQSPPRSKNIDYYRELVNILGHQFEDVEVLSCQNKVTIDNTKGQVLKSYDQEHCSMQKSKFDEVHPYQPKPDMSPAMHGPHGAMLYLDNDVSYSPLHYQLYGEGLQPQHYYTSPNLDVFFNLFPGLSSKSQKYSFTNQPMTTKEKQQKAKDVTTKITLQRQSMAWPFGYDFTLSPVEYSLLHKIHVPHHPYMGPVSSDNKACDIGSRYTAAYGVCFKDGTNCSNGKVEIERSLEGEEDKKRGSHLNAFSSNRVEF